MCTWYHTTLEGKERVDLKRARGAHLHCEGAGRNDASGDSNPWNPHHVLYYLLKTWCLL